MLISSHAFTGPMRPFMFGNSYLNFTTKSTCLGVLIDHKLNWKPQVEALCSKFRAKLKFLKRIKGLPSRVLEDIACRTGVIFLRFFRRGRTSARRARSARHARQEGRKKNNTCTPTIVHAIPPPETPSNHQPITAFDKSGAKWPVMFRKTHTE